MTQNSWKIYHTITINDQNSGLSQFFTSFNLFFVHSRLRKFRLLSFSVIYFGVTQTEDRMVVCCEKNMFDVIKPGSANLISWNRFVSGPNLIPLHKFSQVD